MKLKCKLILLFLPVGLLFGSKMASQVENQPRVEALKKYLLEKDYPEAFGDTRYHARVENILDVDINNDGKKELVVQYNPHYRQSAVVIIYRVSPELELTRVTEGLAPGPLQKLSGDYLDSHGLGQSADFTVGQGQVKPGETAAVLQIT